VVCMEMSAWVSAVSEGGWNIFKDRNTDITKQPRCGQLRSAATERNKQKVDDFIRQDRRITVREIAAQLRVRHPADQEMMEILRYREICSRRVPRLLTEASNCTADLADN
jgi:hypothetical protein